MNDVFMPEDMEKVCSEFYKLAKENLLRDKYHQFLAFLIGPDNSIVAIPGVDRENAGMITFAAEKLNSKGAIIVSEMYISSFDVDDPRGKDPNFAPSKDPEAKEGLIVSVSDAYGCALVKVLIFEKVNDEIIIKDEQCFDEGQMNLVQPWKKPTTLQ